MECLLNNPPEVTLGALAADSRLNKQIKQTLFTSVFIIFLLTLVVWYGKLGFNVPLDTV